MRRSFHSLQLQQQPPLILAAHSWHAATPAAPSRISALHSQRTLAHSAASAASSVRCLHVSACALTAAASASSSSGSAAPSPQPAPGPSGRRLPASAMRVEAAKADPLLAPLAAASASEVRTAAERAWAEGSRCSPPHRWSVPQVLVVLRKLSDAAALEGRREESPAEATAWLARTSATEFTRQRRLKALWELGVQFMGATGWTAATPTEHWSTNQNLIRALIILAARCREFDAGVNLLALCEQNQLVQVLKFKKEQQDGVRQFIDEPLVAALFQCLAHAKPGLATAPPSRASPSVDPSSPEAGQRVLRRVLSSAPAGFDGDCTKLAKSLLRMLQHHGRQKRMTMPVSSSTLQHLAMLFAGMPDGRGIPSTFFSTELPPEPVVKPTKRHFRDKYPAPPADASAADLQWREGVEDHSSVAHQGRSLLEAFEHYAHVHMARGQWSEILPLFGAFLPALEQRAGQARLPSMRSDILNGILFATARFQGERLATTFLQLRTLFPAHPTGRYGLDSHGWSLFISAYLLQPFTHLPADMAELFDLAIASTPPHTHMPIINAYMLFLCDHSIETLPERWTRIRHVLANAMRANSATSEHAQLNGATAAAPLLMQPDLVLFTTVIRFLDRMHSDQVSFSHHSLLSDAEVFVQSRLREQLGPDSPLWPFAILFPSPPPTTTTTGEGDSLTPSDAVDADSSFSSVGTSDATSSWQYLADELHAEAQVERNGNTYFTFNPVTKNVFVPCTGMAAASDVWIRGVCFLTCRALKRAVEMQSATPLPSSQPLSLVLETDAASPSSATPEPSLDQVRNFSLSQPLPADWLYVLERSVHAVHSSQSVSDSTSNTTERMLMALQHVFREMRWHPCESAVLPRPDEQGNEAAATAEAPSPSPAAHEHVFTFNTADNIS